MTRLLVLVLACGALLISTEANYHVLPDLYKEAVKLTVEKAHQGTSQHLNFYDIQGHPTISSEYFDIEILLKATKCPKSTATDHRDDCTFMEKRPLINCRVCSKRSGNDLTDPSIDCATQKNVDEEKRQKMCRFGSIIGGACSICATDLKLEINCMGCY